MSLAEVGKKIDEIKVQISYKIIELFSAGLYSSPNKAFEELVSNSYDALAKRVGVFVPTSVEEDSYLWVCDDGISMDLKGLKQLWKIGYSTKRNDREREKERLQIGKFGIGKLSTYVLANELTYLCKYEGRYLSVTMDYSEIDKEVDEVKLDNEIKLDVRELTEDQARVELEKYLNQSGSYLLDFDLFGEKASESWTFTLMTNLKDKAFNIKTGVLKWILRTGLPLNPNFALTFNGKRIVPSKFDSNRVNTWVIGQDDDTAEKHFKTGKDKDGWYVKIPDLGKIRGEISLFEDSLVGGKSEEKGRSHGIFLIIRGRLINPDDALLGMEAFQHGAFNRTRIVVNADGLDKYLTSAREAIVESEAYSELKNYIKRKFNNEIRQHYNEYIENESKRKSAVQKVSNSPTSLSRRPFLAVARKFYNKEIPKPRHIDLPELKSQKEIDQFLESLEDDLTSESGVIQQVVTEFIGSQYSLAKFDLAKRILKVNFTHPFFANYRHDLRSDIPFQLIGISEILTEAQLIEAGVDEEFIKLIMEKRDKTLRQLTYGERLNAPLVAQMIADSLSDSTGLEDALFAAFKVLGFETIKKGKSGEPDGVAYAYLGYRDQKNANYSLVYDAKSTSKKSIAANTINTSTSIRHKKKYDTNYAVVISRDFEGADKIDSAASLDAMELEVTLIRAKDLMKLVLYSSPKRVGLDELEDLFKNCFTVQQTSKWIDDLINKEVDHGPIKELMETIVEFQKTDTEPPKVASVRVSNPRLKKYSENYIIALIRSLEQLVPGLISLDGDIISLNCSEERLMDAVYNVINTDLPNEYASLYLKSFEED